MEDFFQELLAGESPDAPPVVDLCLDWSLVKDDLPGRFERLSCLEVFPALEDLSIQGHALSSTQGLPPFPHLRSLNLSQNEIRDLAAFPDLPTLTFLDLSLNELSHLQDLPAFPRLTELHLSHNFLSTLDHLPHLSQLHSLHLTGNKSLRSPLPLPALPHLQQLFAKDCPLPLHSLREFQQLQLLRLTPTQNDFSQALAGMSALKELALYLKRLEGDFQLPRLDKLETLDLVDGRHISGLAGWDGLPSLQNLRLKGFNKDWDLGSIAEASELRHVELQEIAALDWKVLASLPRLEGIALGRGVNAAGLPDFEAARPEVELTFR